MSAFFIPGIADDGGGVEHAYLKIRKQIELKLGRPPNARRILRLWTRRGSVDCITEVGRPDPLRGGTVIAIFDMGLHRPYVIWWQLEGGSGNPVCEVLGHTAYSVLEFDA